MALALEPSHLIFLFLMLLSERDGNSRTGQSEEAGNGKIASNIQWAEDPRKSNATLHDFHEMLTVSVLSSLCGGPTCVDMADFAKNNEGFLRRFMRLEHGPPSHDAFSRLLRMLDPVPFAADWAKAMEAEGASGRSRSTARCSGALSRRRRSSPLHLGFIATKVHGAT